MILPEKILIFDDEPKGANRLILFLNDLLWIEDFSQWKDSQDNAELKKKLDFDEDEMKEIGTIDSRIKHLFKNDRYHLKKKVEKIIIETSKDVDNAESFIDNIKKNKIPVAAFIDFQYKKEDAREYLSTKYGQLPGDDKWKKIEDDEQKGGCYFSAIFDASIKEKRLNCISTVSPPRRYPREATVEAANARSYPNALSAVIAMLNEWAQLFWPPPAPGLDDIWNNTAEWFKDDDIRDNKKPTICHYFLPKMFENEEIKESYKNSIKGALGLELPSEWFKDKNSFNNLHESLKTICGSYYCGTPKKESKYNLTMGGVYLIAILAMRDAGKYYDLTKKSQRSTFQLKNYPEFNSKFLPLQSENDAKNTAKSLYAVFLNSFRKEGKHGDMGLKELAILNNGKKLKFTFEWSATQEDGLAKKIEGMQLNHKPGEKSATLTGAIQSLLVNMNRSSIGFGSPGTIWMENKYLYIASANSPTMVLIVCSDSGSEGRGEKWAELFLNTEVSEVYVAKSSEEIILYKQNIDNYSTIEIKELPQTFACVMVHQGQGDSNRWEELKKDYTIQSMQLFRFSSPGIYNVEDGLPIMRTTSPDFDITVTDVSQLVDYSSGRRPEIPDICKPKSTGELITSIFIFCMGYLSAGVGAGAINDEEVKTLIGWNDNIKTISPNTEADWNEGWENVKNSQWWDDLGKINNLKEKVRIEMDGNLDEHLEKLIDFIKGKGTIEHFETVKTVLKMLKEKKWF
jgi:hypothetical protein